MIVCPIISSFWLVKLVVSPFLLCLPPFVSWCHPVASARFANKVLHLGCRILPREHVAAFCSPPKGWLEHLSERWQNRSSTEISYDHEIKCQFHQCYIHLYADFMGAGARGPGVKNWYFLRMRWFATGRWQTSFRPTGSQRFWLIPSHICPSFWGAFIRHQWTGWREKGKTHRFTGYVFTCFFRTITCRDFLSIFPQSIEPPLGCWNHPFWAGEIAMFLTRFFSRSCPTQNGLWSCGLHCLSPDLVGGLEHFLFFHILGIVTPTD